MIDQIHHHSWHAMGTQFEAFLVGDDLEHLQTSGYSIEDECRRIEGVFSRYDPTSELARLNREAWRGPVRVSVEMWKLLHECAAARVRTAGCFDVTASRGHGENETPLQFDDQRRTIRFTQASIQIDLGGVGKGYTLDCLAETLRTLGIASALLNAGTSSLRALGPPPGSSGWLIDLRNPFQAERVAIGQLSLIDRSFSCSATHHPGQFISDVRDPRNGSVLDRSAACIVLAQTATDAEIVSTAALVMGRDTVIGTDWPSTSIAWVEPGDPVPVITWLTESR